MTTVDDPGDPLPVFVSMQAPGHPDAAVAHLAPGVLVGPDLVVVPAVGRDVLERKDTRGIRLR